MLNDELLAFDRAGPLMRSGVKLAREVLALDYLSTRRFDRDNRLHVEVCNISRSAVNPYYGREIPNATALGLEPDRVYMLYRDPDELAKAAPTFARLQLLDLHTAVDADDPKLEHTAGTVGSDVRFEAPFLKASLAVWTKKAIDRILTKQSAQLSCSYYYDADMTPGTSPEGVAFDGSMRHIVGNHVALVREGRAGLDVCVNDSLPTGLQMKYPKILKVVQQIFPSASDNQLLALDQAFDKKAKDDENGEEAMDEREASLDSREEEMDAKDSAPETEKPRNDRKSARDKRAKDRAARDSARKAGDSDPTLDPEEKKLKSGGASDEATVSAMITRALKSGGYVTNAEAQQMANDAVNARNDLERARASVVPLVGAVTAAMDSADAVYRFALDHVKVSHKGIKDTAALAAVVDAEIRARKGGYQPAYDAAPTSEFSLNDIFKVA